MGVGKDIRTAREGAGITLPDLASDLSISSIELAALETEAEEPNAQLLDRVAERLPALALNPRETAEKARQVLSSAAGEGTYSSSVRSLASRLTGVAEKVAAGEPLDAGQQEFLRYVSEHSQVLDFPDDVPAALGVLLKVTGHRVASPAPDAEQDASGDSQPLPSGAVAEFEVLLDQTLHDVRGLVRDLGKDPLIMDEALGQIDTLRETLVRIANDEVDLNIDADERQMLVTILAAIGKASPKALARVWDLFTFPLIAPKMWMGAARSLFREAGY